LSFFTKKLYSKEGTNYFENGVYKVGPPLPTGAYVGQFIYPCTASIDNNSGIVISGQYFSMLAWHAFTAAFTYNFTSNAWKQLKDTPFKAMQTNCQRVTLANGKQAILVVGNSIL
jgi:hypothetical protein